jgi:hydrophobe/amphiphile efflux-1 (HAE1) family protein
MTLSDLSIRRPVFAWMLMFGLIVFGAISLGRLGVSLVPDVDFPVLSVEVTWEGAAPEVMEAEVADQLEQAVISVEGLKDLSSTVRQGDATLMLEFQLDRDIDVALQEVQSKISSIRFPKDVDPAVITKTNKDDDPIMFLGVASETRSLRDIIIYIDDVLRDQFQIVPGVGEIYLSGFADRNLRVWLDNEKLKKYELTVLDVEAAIAGNHAEIAGGYMDNPLKEMNVRTMGEGLNVKEVENILITSRGGKPIYDTTIHLKDIARIEDSLNDLRRISRIDGRQGVGLGIRKLRGSNAVDVAKGIRAKMSILQKMLPPDIHLTVNFDRTKFIEESVNETEFTLILSTIITGLVCWLFLGSWSSTFNVFLSIPTSVVGTFIVMYVLHFTLNLFTLLALALAIGIVVDDAIMVLENIVRHAEMGKNRVQAATDGAREITFAAIAASIAVIAIFLPIVFMQGIIGKFLFQFGVALSAAVALSLLEAITLTPMRCSQFLSTKQDNIRLVRWTSAWFERLESSYKKVLTKCLNVRWMIILVSLTVAFLAFFVLKFIPGELIPRQETGTFILQVQTPVGSSIEFTSARMKEAEAILMKRPETLHIFEIVGGITGGDVSSGLFFVSLKPAPSFKEKLSNFFHRKAQDSPDIPYLSQFQLMDYCKKEVSKIKGFTIVQPRDVSNISFAAQRGGSFNVDFNIRGADYSVLKQKTAEIMERLKNSGVVIDMNTDYREGMPEVRIIPDREKTSESSVSMQTIGDTINAAVGGLRVAKFTQGDRRYDVRIRLEKEQRQDPSEIGDLLIRTQYGELLPLRNLAKIEVVPTLQTVTRRMRQRSISIFGNVSSQSSQAEALKIIDKVCKEVLPEGYQYFLSGGTQTLAESIGGFLFVLFLGIVVAYMVLASQFNSFIHPVTVLLALPFGVSGALLALYLAHMLESVFHLHLGASLNLYSGIGLILLMGIVKKNSILLVEFTNKKRYEEGMPLREAILEAAPIRLRPILMTSCATMAAAVPPMLALGPGAESRIPMAIAVFGGVFVSTLLTLFVVPCAYSLMANLEKPYKH